jgi:hypothetical protein
MSNELNRIRELSGLQQEAAVSLKGKESALKAWYNKYSKYTGGNGDPLPFGLIKAYTESGIISDGYEENELAKAEKALGKKEGDWEDQDWQKVYSMTPITQGMEKDLLTATGSKTVDEELLAKVYDVIEDMYPSYDQVLGKKESAVAEAPASGDQALANELSMYFAKLAKEMLQNMQRPNTNDVEYEEFVDIAQAFKGGIQAGLDEVNLSRFEFSSNPFGDFGRSINDGPDEELVKILAKYGYQPGPDSDNDEATIVKQQEESAVAEAPAGLTAPQKQGLAALAKKYAKRKTYGGGGLIDGYLDYLAQTGVWTDAADEKEFDVALKKLGHDDLDAWEQDAEGEEFEQFLKLAPITAQAQNDVEKVLGKGFYNNTTLINAASDYVGSLPETAVQPMPVLNAVKETPAISQVDEAIKKATAQLKSFSNFDGLKPYKPKKK